MRFNQILFVDSLQVEDGNTARRLYEDVSLRAQVYQPAPATLYRRIESGAEFLELLSQLAAVAENAGDIPVLHVECHGSIAGLEFADKSFASWAEMKGSLIELNVATQANQGSESTFLSAEPLICRKRRIPFSKYMRK